ncbi:MAG: 2-phospho-L-lactate transferase [Sphingomonadales bacterium]
MSDHFIALSGGVGGAKLALGLARVLAPENLTIVANTGDDFEHLGLHIAPDLDTVMYTLAGVANTETGWGRAGETWSFMAALGELGGETWFQLGDKDLAVHIERRDRLSRGQSLSAVTTALSKALGVKQSIVPMSDDPVRTMLMTPQGELAFQHYFVRDRCEPRISAVRFDGAGTARPAPAFLQALEDKDLAGVIICPSNPYVSVGPILALPGIREALGDIAAPVVAVSPIIKGLAVRGPAAKMMAELGMEASVETVARHYRGLVRGLVIDDQDAASRALVEAEDMAVGVTNTIMNTLGDREELARYVIDFTKQLSRSGR